MNKSDNKENNGMNGSLVVNNMQYALQKSLTNTINATSYKQSFDKRVYRGNELMNCQLNSGSDFVDWSESFMFVRVKTIAPSAGVPADARASFGVGSALNLFSEIKITSRSGVECARMSNAGFINNMRAKWKYSSEYLTRFGEVVGFGNGVEKLNAASDTAYALPLSFISSFFEPTENTPCPPQLASGLQISISTSDVKQALRQGTTELNTITDYELSDVHLYIKVLTKQDSIARAINQKSSGIGLNYMYDRFFSTSLTSQIGATSQEIHLSKAVSFAKRVMVAQYVDSLGSLALDNYDTVGFNYTSLQFKIGSNSFPKDALSSGLNSVFTVAQAYVYTQQSWCSVDHDRSKNGVSYNDYVNGINGVCHVGVCLEKDNDLKLSGVPLNNSKIIDVNLEFNALASTTKFLTILQYDGLAKVYLNNVSSKI